MSRRDSIKNPTDPRLLSGSVCFPAECVCVCVCVCVMSRYDSGEPE